MSDAKKINEKHLPAISLSSRQSAEARSEVKMKRRYSTASLFL
jgi:hypothetical protein